ncbi:MULTISPECIES: ROK family protein [unclassified Thermosipho (in: thermotogales)]|uniref:ROK family transcriptional regulator n=1 Tax=unclassified Thermosipho (in: thermotogales) TaxID=2676525 RepID=UPI0009849517|nr:MULTISPECIES: ROK family protein [unclassified Thermosipho (in: thermotogales)]MBT1247695.1 ROK family transcriptional regulator [Thermosipho sp. 1244]OOC46727.1 ROK family transcriptional regulator [Thermosipho sp. 1223]
MVTKSLKKIIEFSWKEKVVTAKILSEKLNLEKSTVSRNVAKLRNLNILVKTKELPASSQGGRKTVVYSFNKDLSYILGISIEQDGIEYIKTNLFSEIIFKRKISKKISSENIIDEINRIVLKNEGIIAIGISIPGIVKNNTVVYSEALNIKNLNFNKHFSIPTFVEKDAICGALKYSLLKNSILYFQLSIPYFINEPVGFGVGIIINGLPVYGTNHLSGEYKISKTLIDQRLSFSKFTLIDIKDFLKFISKKIAFLTSIFDPELVVIGGNITLHPQIKMLKNFIKEEIYLENKRQLDILIENGKKFVNAEGVAIKTLKNIFSTDDGIKYFLKKVT